MVTLILIVLGLLPGFAWLIFYLKEDIKHPEPKILIFYTFLGGALVTLLVLWFQYRVHDWLIFQGFSSFGLVSFILLASVEEFFKFFTVFLLISRRKEFDEPIDAMIYMIVAALGFATVENVASVLQTGSITWPSVGPVETTVLRFVGATLLHTLASGLVGYQWGQAIYKKSGHVGMIGAGLVVATLLHAVFNYLIIRSEPIALPLIFLIFFALFILGDFEKLKRESP